MERCGKDIYNYKTVRFYLVLQNKLDVVDWLDNNREKYTASVLNKEHHYIGFYYE